MHQRLPLIFRHILYNLRGGFLLRPLIIALSLGILGASLSFLEESHPALSTQVPHFLFPTHADPGVAQVILSVIATSIMTVVSIVFAILLMTLTLASMQFSPRIIVSFSRDRTTQWTLGIFLGTFCYCVAALPAAHFQPTPLAPVATVLGAMLLALACVAWLLYFIHHISHAVSVNYIVDRIAAETLAVIDQVMPDDRGEHPTEVDAEFTAAGVVLADTSGYIRFIDVDCLLDLAVAGQLRTRIVRRVGHFIPAGTPLLEVASNETLDAATTQKFRRAFDIGPSRTLQQDVEFGVLQIVDIALRAISPAVNDPSTAINCIDQLSRILIHFARRENPKSAYYDLSREASLIVPWITFEGLLHTAFDQIRHYAASDVAVLQRLLRALSDIAIASGPGDIQRCVTQWGSTVVEECDRVRLGSQFHLLEHRLACLYTNGIPARSATPKPRHK